MDVVKEIYAGLKCLCLLIYSTEVNAYINEKISKNVYCCFQAKDIILYMPKKVKLVVYLQCNWYTGI